MMINKYYSNVINKNYANDMPNINITCARYSASNKKIGDGGVVRM